MATLWPDLQTVIDTAVPFDLGEATGVRNANQMPDGVAAEIGVSITADEDGNLTLDGDYFDEGETALFGSSIYDDQLTRPRALETYEGKAQVTAGSAGAGNHFPVFLDQDPNTPYASSENVVGQLGNGSTGFDIKTPLAVEMPGGFDGTIVSVSAGLLHTTFLAEGDRSSFNFSTDETLSLATVGKGSFGDDLLRAGAGDDQLNGRWGGDIVSGGAGDDLLNGGFGDDLLNGGASNDRVHGGFGRDALAGGEGEDVLFGGLGRDSFVFDGGHDVLRDFDSGFEFLWWSLSGDKISLDIAGVNSFADVLASASQVGHHTRLEFSEDDSLLLRNVCVAELDSDDFAFV